MTHKIKIITDSASDLPPEMLAEYDIEVVPLYVIWGGQELRDRIDIQPEDFYARIETDPEHPSTSQPTPQDFAAAIERAKANGAEEVVIFTISTGMSSTNNSAHQAAEKVSGIPVTIVDTKANTMSEGWQVLAAARARDAGGSVQEIVEAAAHVRKHIVTLLYVDTLKYLHRGGRIGGAVRLMGSAINLKPLLMVDHETGIVEAHQRTRTKKRAVETLYQDFFKQLDLTKPVRVAIMHGNVIEDVKELAERIKQEYNPVEIVTGMTSPVLGVHTGPGAIALCGYAAD
jgi:DegV family protein with EDD domain